MNGEDPAVAVRPHVAPNGLVDRNITGTVIAAFYVVYDELGFGFFESVYMRALHYELEQRGLRVEREVVVDVFYKGMKVGSFRADMLVEKRVVVEGKATRSLADSDRKQVLNYLRATDLEVALLLHFGPEPAFYRMIFSNDRKVRSRASSGTSKSVPRFGFFPG